MSQQNSNISFGSFLNEAVLRNNFTNSYFLIERAIPKGVYPSFEDTEHETLYLINILAILTCL